MNKQAYLKMMKTAAGQIDLLNLNSPYTDVLKGKTKQKGLDQRVTEIQNDIAATRDAQLKRGKQATAPYRNAQAYSKAYEAVQRGEAPVVPEDASPELKSRIESLAQTGKANIIERGQNRFDWGSKLGFGGAGTGLLLGSLLGWNMLDKKRHSFLKLLNAIAFGGLGALALGTAGHFIGKGIGGYRPLASKATTDAPLKAEFGANSGITNWFPQGK